MRNYGLGPNSFGLEPTYQLYVEHSVEIFREIRRILRPDGTLWLNLGDSYASKPPGNKTVGVSAASTLNGVNGKSGVYRETLANSVAQKMNTIVGDLKPKDLIGIPWRVAFALQADGWYLRQDNIWSKPNPMPESVTDRTTRAHEYMFHFSKSARYYYDADAVKEPAVHAGKRVQLGEKSFAKGQARGTNINPSGNGLADHYDVKQFRNLRSVWHISPKPYKDAHFATFPPELITPCILAGCPPNGIVLDPFAGSGTVGQVCTQHNRHAILIEQNPKYVAMIQRRCNLSPQPGAPA